MCFNLVVTGGAIDNCIGASSERRQSIRWSAIRRQIEHERPIVEGAHCKSPHDWERVRISDHCSDISRHVGRHCRQ
jgi:hypothetical protein